MVSGSLPQVTSPEQSALSITSVAGDLSIRGDWDVHAEASGKAEQKLDMKQGIFLFLVSVYKVPFYFW